MIELKNSKTTYLGKASGGDQYSLDAFIGAVQMREPGGQWQDIKPRLVRDADGWHIEGAPYYAEVKDDGTRLFCPYDNERSRYLRLPSPALFSGLDKNIVSNPARLDGQLLPNQITMPADWGEFRIIFGNTGMYFEALFTKAPPAGIFGKDSLKITLDAETAGYDIGQLLAAVSGVGIPPPRLMSVNGELSGERRLDWSYKNGQLELGFDFADLPFPILLKNTTVDVQVGAGADDVEVFSGSTQFSSNTGWNTAGYHSSYFYYYVGWAGRFTVAIPQGSIVDSAYVTVRARGNTSANTCYAYLTAEDADNAAQITSQADWQSRARTTGSGKIAWDNIGAWTNGTDYNSPEIKAAIQAVVNRAGWSSGNHMNIFVSDFEDQRSSLGAFRDGWSYDGNSGNAPRMHIEYTAGGATEKTAAETGIGSDTRQLFLVSLVKAENGGGSEQSLLSRLLSSGDAGSGMEALIALIAVLIKPESGLGSENITGRDVVLNESGNAIDISALLASIVKGDTGSGFEQSLLTWFVARQSAETGSGIDVAALIARLSTLENGAGVDVGWLVGLKNILSGDLGTGYEALKALVGTPRAGSDMKLPGRPGHVRIPSKGVSL